MRNAHGPLAMQTPFDTMAKALIDAALEGVCEVSLQEPVAPETLYADAVIDPRAPREAIAQRGLLGRMACSACVIEAFATVPTVFDVDRCSARASMLRATQRRERVLWVIAPGRARSVIEAYGLAGSRAWPRGVYVGATERVARLVVVSELPRTSATLLLRLMGRGAVLRGALTEASELSADAWERPFVLRVLLRMRSELRRMSGEQADTKEIEMRYAELAKSVDKMLEDLRVESEALGEARGEARGEALGRAAAMRAAIEDVCELLGIEVSEGRRARLAALSLEELDALRVQIKRERRWPD